MSERYYITEDELDHIRTKLDQLGMALDPAMLSEDIEAEESIYEVLNQIEER